MVFQTSINNKTYYLGQTFTSGLSNPEVKKYSGTCSILIIDQQSHALLIKKKISKLYYSSNNLNKTTNLNVSPYFDDFNENDNYYKVLFKPGVLFKQENLLD